MLASLTGKSYTHIFLTITSLFEVVMQLRQTTTNRVIYIPDCGGWGDATGYDIMTTLLDAIALAFPNDQEILDACKETTLTEVSITELLAKLPSIENPVYSKMHSILSQEWIEPLCSF